MTITEYFTEDPFLFLILLAGIMGHWVASGAERANYRALHVVLGIALFFGIGLLTYWLINRFLDNSKIVAASVSILVIVLGSYVWRRWWSDKAFRGLRKLGITASSFGPSRVWDSIMSIPNTNFQRYHVILKDKTLLISDIDVLREMGNIDVSLGLLADEEGNVALLVTKIQKDGEAEIDNVPVEEDTKYTEYTYVPASNIDTIKVYFKKIEKNAVVVAANEKYATQNSRYEEIKLNPEEGRYR